MRKTYTDQEITEMYITQEKTYKEIQRETGMCCAKIAKIVRGLKSRSSVGKSKFAKWNLTANDEDRQKIRDRMSELGKRSCRQSQKCWTKPEREFFEILKEMNVRVLFPEFMLEVFGVKNNIPSIGFDVTMYCQYPLQRYVLDFVDVDKKMVFAINGDFWHANPKLYAEQELSEIQKHNVKSDKLREKYLLSKGWSTCIIWESEIKWNKQLVIERIKEIYSGAKRKLVTPSDLHSDLAGFDPQFAHHSWEERLKKLWFKEGAEKQPRKFVEKTCEMCGETYSYPACCRPRKFCSVLCKNKMNRKVDRPPKEYLEKILQEMSWTAIGKMYNVTDNAVRKWARSYGLIEKHREGRGFESLTAHHFKGKHENT